MRKNQFQLRKNQFWPPSDRNHFSSVGEKPVPVEKNQFWPPSEKIQFSSVGENPVPVEKNQLGLLRQKPVQFSWAQTSSS